jgi:hypothetical protein
MSLVNVGIIFILGIACVIGIWIAIVFFHKEEEEDRDNPYGINFLTQHTQGGAIGIERYVKYGKDGRRIIKFSPRDVYVKDMTQIPDIDIIVEKNKTISVPKGAWSKDKNINIYLPPSADAFPEPLKSTEFGKMLIFWTALKDANNSELDAFKEGMKRQSAHIKSMGAGEISVEKITQLDEFFMEALDAIKDTKKKDEGTGGFTPPRFGGQMGGGSP